MTSTLTAAAVHSPIQSGSCYRRRRGNILVVYTYKYNGRGLSTLKNMKKKRCEYKSIDTLMTHDGYSFESEHHRLDTLIYKFF